MEALATFLSATGTQPRTGRSQPSEESATMDIERIQFQKHGDHGGMLVALEQERNVPFEIRRVYYVFATEPKVHRGRHAHRHLKQLAVAVRGSVRIRISSSPSKSSAFSQLTETNSSRPRLSSGPGPRSSHPRRIAGCAIRA